MVRTGHLVCLEFPERWDQEVFLDPEDSMVSLVHRVYLAQRELLVLRVMKVQLDPLDPLGKQGTKDLWDLLDLLDHWGLLARLDQEENLDYLDCLELMACQERMEIRENLDQRETRVHRVTLVLLASLAPEELRETSENEVNKEKRVKREKLVWRGRRETWDLKVTEECLGLLVNKVLRDLKAPKDQRAPLVSLDPLDLLEKRAKMDHPGLLVILEDLETKETRELKEEMVHQV